MSRFKVGILLAGVAALILTSIAVADENKPSRTPVAAHFTATGGVKTTNCADTGSTPNNASGTPMTGSTITETRGQLSGTSTSADKRLNGAVRITLRIVVHRNGFGIATGTFRVGKIEADLMAVVSGTNKLDGLLRSRTGGKRLFANFSATLGGSAASSGSTLTGDFGTGSSVNTAVLGAGGCGA